MTKNFPSEVQKVLDSALLHLLDKNRPEPDLESLTDWLEGDGWDDVVSGLIGSCIYADRIMDHLNDDSLLEFTDIADKSIITNFDRIEFGRERIESFLSDSMDSIHSIEIDSKKTKAKLCFAMYYHPQGGATISGLRVCYSHQDYLDECEDVIITDARKLSDKDILILWKQSEAKIKAWRKKFRE